MSCERCERREIAEREREALPGPDTTAEEWADPSTVGAAREVARAWLAAASTGSYSDKLESLTRLILGVRRKAMERAA